MKRIDELVAEALDIGRQQADQRSVRRHLRHVIVRQEYLLGGSTATFCSTVIVARDLRPPSSVSVMAMACSVLVLGAVPEVVYVRVRTISCNDARRRRIGVEHDGEAGIVRIPKKPDFGSSDLDDVPKHSPR